MSEAVAKQAAWTVTWWMVYTGKPGQEDFRIIAGALTEKDALLAAAKVGIPAGARVGQVKERA